MGRIFITGDKHGDFFSPAFNLTSFCDKNATTKDDILIILGDAGINYYVDEIAGECLQYKPQRGAKMLKKMIESLPITLFCIHGNHEARPEHIIGYHEKEWHGGVVYCEEEYPSILFAKDGEVYDFNAHSTLVLGGAYSVDKYYRLARYNAGFHSYKWFPDEQMSEEMKERIREKYFHKHYDLILSHTCPQKYEPVETFLPGIDQSQVDKSMEEFLGECEENIRYDKWYCGHYHIEKMIDKLQFLFDKVIEV